jgi:hypothetical protein
VNEVFVRIGSYHMVFDTVGADTSTTDPRWRVDSIEVREGRKGGKVMESKKGIQGIK